MRREHPCSCSRVRRPEPTQGLGYWQASQASGFSSEQAMASVGVYSRLGSVVATVLTVVLAIFVAGRERR